MSAGPISARLADRLHVFVRKSFTPRFDTLGEAYASHGLWRRLRELGTDIWLDTGSIEDSARLWTREMSALTTNNTLLNREVQTGVYDSLIIHAEGLLSQHAELAERQRMLEIAFVLNARHGLKLVERFDARVSVEEHTDLAGDVDSAVEYARRYYAICPERFLIKIPFTPAGLLATRRLSNEGIPVNHTLGFSARQNYLIARIGRPQFVNVFLGRLNSFVADNRLGDGSYVGERATLASQAVIRNLRRTYGVPCRQIGASFRAGAQLRDLAGSDVMTVPPKVAQEFLELELAPGDLTDRTGQEYCPPLAEGVDPAAVGLESLWDIGPELPACVDALENENLDAFTPADLVGFLADHGCGDVLVSWSDGQVAVSAAEGKIPRLESWRSALEDKSIGLDSLMNLAGLNSFAADQKAMDDRVAGVLKRS